jgi:hypothetical protein
MEREIALKEKAQKEATEKRVEKLENDISEIKQMLLDMRKV